MWKLRKPTDNVEDVFSECINNTRSKELKDRLELCKDEIACATLEFEDKAIKNMTHTIDSNDKVAGIITTDEMCKIYTNKMAKKSSPGRKYYDKYLAAPKNSVCPLCGQRIVSTLDHYLPKKKYPSLVVSPANLIPACKDCNKVKGDIVFINSKQETIHPYFDDVNSERWLYAKIIEEEPIAFTFYVEKPNSWDDILYERMKNHFEIFELNMLYSAHAAQEITHIQYMLVNLLEKAGVDAVRTHLIENMESCENAHLNSWKTAMYRALYDNEWFYQEWLKTQKKDSN